MVTFPTEMYSVCVFFCDLFVDKMSGIFSCAGVEDFFFFKTHLAKCTHTHTHIITKKQPTNSCAHWSPYSHQTSGNFRP